MNLLDEIRQRIRADRYPFRVRCKDGRTYRVNRWGEMLVHPADTYIRGLRRDGRGEKVMAEEIVAVEDLVRVKTAGKRRKRKT